MTDDIITAEKVGTGWRWIWRPPWASLVSGGEIHKTRKAALVAGEKWLRTQQSESADA